VWAGSVRGMAEPVVAVRGESVREVDPEIATFSVTVSARDRDRQETLRRLAARVDALRGVLDRYAESIEKRETSGLYVRPEIKGSGERVSAYSGSVTTTVTVSDFTVLGELLLRLAGQDQTTVAGPWWGLRPGSPVHREARRAAIDDALDRGRQYAEALGARVTGLVELADTGRSATGAVRFATAMGFRGGTDASAQPTLDLEPQRQTVTATVEARFTISEPAAVGGDTAG
jgi:uncharacterized protein YggE